MITILNFQMHLLVLLLQVGARLGIVFTHWTFSYECYMPEVQYNLEIASVILIQTVC